jgi:hypothetical protein
MPVHGEGREGRKGVESGHLSPQLLIIIAKRKLNTKCPDIEKGNERRPKHQNPRELET